MSRAYFSPSSRRDLQEILEYIARDKPGAALRHIARLEEACQKTLKWAPHATTCYLHYVRGLWLNT